MAGHKLAIIASQRSGTHAFGSVLTYNNFLSFDEILHPNDAMREPQRSAQVKYYFNKERIAANSLAFDPRSVAKDYFSYLSTIAHGESFYIDLKYNSFHFFGDPFFNPLGMPAILKYLAEFQYKFVHIVRRNAFQRYLSSVIADQTKQWHFDSAIVKPEEVKLARVNIDPKICLYEIKSHLDATARTDNWLRSFGNKVTLYYEDLFIEGNLSSASATLIKDSIGVELSNLNTGFFKPERAVTDVVVNFTEIRDVLNDAGFGWMTS